MNPLASVAIGRSFFSLTGEAQALDRRVSCLAAGSRCFWQERLRKSDRAKAARDRGAPPTGRQTDRTASAAPASSVRFLLRQSGRIGFQINDQAADADTESSQWIFQRYNGGNSKKA
jgi:hypothetical protein